MATKKCTKCGIEKPLAEFYYLRTRDTHYTYCKICVAKRAREARAKPGYNEWHKAYRSANKPHILELTRSWRAKNTHKSRAYTDRWRRADPARALFTAAKARSKKFGIAFDLQKLDIHVPDRCPILGIPFAANTGRGAGAWWDSPSLDRIDNDLGYVKGNVQVVTRLANCMKSNATREHLLAFADWVRKTYT